VYTGAYVNGRRTGEGRFYFANGDLYTGQWNDNVMEGSGRYYYQSGQRFEGTFRRGKRIGKGKLQRTNGDIDIGLYVNDVRVGLGVRWNADRTVAWKMMDGHVQHRIHIAEAVALDYDIEIAAAAMERLA
jgi:MORN repeat